MFLTAKQLEDLTGLTQGAAQIRWLRKNGIEHTVRVDGKPRVMAENMKKRPEGTRASPRFEALGARH